MPISAEAPLAAWESFYVIVGSSSAALTGLMFVGITLGAERRTSGTPHVVAAFGTPTVVHFGAAFLLSAICSAPWQHAGNPALLIGAIGLAGVVYGFIVIRRTRRQSTYRPVLEDWVWHVVLPVGSYTTLVAASLALRSEQPWALYAIGTATVVLVIAGIHNAWDAVTYRALGLDQPKAANETGAPDGPA